MRLREDVAAAFRRRILRGFGRRGPGIMEASNRGPTSGAPPQWVSISSYRATQFGNTYQDISLLFRHFFRRKAMFVRCASAYVFLPGGFGRSMNFRRFSCSCRRARARACRAYSCMRLLARLAPVDARAARREKDDQPLKTWSVQVIDEPNVWSRRSSSIRNIGASNRARAEREILLNLYKGDALRRALPFARRGSTTVC